jgi:hypothetical protein
MITWKYRDVYQTWNPEEERFTPSADDYIYVPLLGTEERGVLMGFGLKDVATKLSF